MLKGAATALMISLTAIALFGCIASKTPLLSESDAITSIPSGNFIRNGSKVGADKESQVARWKLSREGKKYRLEGPINPKTGKPSIFVGTFHPFDKSYVIFQMQNDIAESGKGYLYALVSKQEDWLFINPIYCNSNILRRVGGHGSCDEIKSRDLLVAVAKIAAKSPLDNHGPFEANAGAALLIESAE